MFKTWKYRLTPRFILTGKGIDTVSHAFNYIRNNRPDHDFPSISAMVILVECERLLIKDLR